MPVQIITERGTKAIDWTPYGSYENMIAATSIGASSAETTLRMLVPYFQRGIDMTANKVSILPRRIVDKNTGEEVDPETAWGGVQNPGMTMYKVAASLCGGAAYLIPRIGSGGIFELQYVTPNSMKPEFDTVSGEPLRFKRTLSTGATEYYAPEKVIYFWLPDDTVEIGPGVITPNRNAMTAAEIVAAMNSTLVTYSKNGFIPPMFAVADGMTVKGEAERAEKVLSEVIRGAWKRLVKIVNSKSMVPQPIGAGMDQLRNTYIQLVRQAIEDIGTSYGIPPGVFLSNSATYATATVDEANWLTSGVFVKVYTTMQDTFNAQLFSKFNRELDFDVLSLDAFKADEKEMSGAYAQLVGTGMQPSLAAAMVGLDMPIGYEYEDLDRPATERAPTPAPAEDLTEQVREMDETARALMKWQGYAEKHWSKRAEFAHPAIPPTVAYAVKADLLKAQSTAELPRIFAEAGRDLPALRIAAAIERLAK